MSQYVKITEDGPQDGVVDEPAEVSVNRIWGHHKYGLKMGFEIPAPWEDEEASETLKEGLDWSWTHRQWNDQAEEWEADLSCLNKLVTVMSEAGYTVTVDLEVAKDFESHEDRKFLSEYRQ